MRKVVIVGYGPAGITAAIYLKRSGIDSLVIGKDYGALEGYSDLVENYYGFAEPIEGKQIIKNGIEQAKRLGIEVLTESIISIDLIEGGFKIVTSKKHVYESKAVLLATGKTRQTLSIPRFVKYRGKGISMCATCDGYFYRKKKLAVIGCGPYMLHELEYLNRISNDVTIFTHGYEFSSEVNNPVIFEEIKGFIGDEKLTHIVTNNGKYAID
jgi:thioredoxin reductase (NADPH)